MEAVSQTQIWEDANANRYLTGIGLVLVLYDHILTADDEVQLVWQAKPSFAKKAFLFNRYLVPIVLIVWATLMNNFNGSAGFTSTTCQGFFVFSALAGVVSIGIANVLVLLRVIALWDRDWRKALFMTVFFLISFCATFSLMVLVVVKMLPGVSYNLELHMCVSVLKVAELPAVWGAPMIFEVLVLIFVCWNAFDRPRSRDTHLTRVLARDGMGFFASLTVLRLINLSLATLVRPDLAVLGVFFVWSMTTLVLNRALLNIHKAATVRDVLPRRSLYVEGSRSGSIVLNLVDAADKGFTGEAHEML